MLRILKLLLPLSLALSSLQASASDVTPSPRVKRAVLVRSDPDTGSAPIGRLTPGSRLRFEKAVPGWYRVRLADGRAGYVAKSWTTIVDESRTANFNAPSIETRVHVIDVGTGLAVFVEGPDFTMLYDAGSQDDLANGGRNRVVSYIRAARPDVTTIDHLVLSHPHKDHLELMPDVFANYAVKNVWDSGAVNKTVGYCRFLKAVEAEPGVRYHDAVSSDGFREVAFTNDGCSGTVRIARSGMMTDRPVPLGSSATMNILWRDASKHSDANENTLVVRLDAAGRRLLLAGNAEAGERRSPETAPSPRSIEAGLIACCSDELRSDVLVVGHHGSLTSSRRAFLDAVGAKIFVISSGPHPYSGVMLPDEAVVAELLSRGQVISTADEDEACELQERKVGPDVDESPGGCSSVLVRLTPLAAMAGRSPVID